MQDWRNFLISRGIVSRKHSGITSGEELADGNLRIDETLFRKLLLAPLLDLGLISLTGPDSRKFLQGQITCNINDLTRKTSITGAHCTPQGRMVANFRLVEAADEGIWLIAPRSIIPLLQQSLERYAVFFKTELRDRFEDFALLGLMGKIPASPAAELDFPTAFETDNVSTHESVTVIGTAKEQLLLVAPVERGARLWDRLALSAQPVGPDLWQLDNIRRGIADILPQTSSMFVPQMLNLQALGAISFRKGCYTGQEVVARMKYRGKLKRRMYRCQIATGQGLTPGAECRLSPDGQSVGNLVISSRIDAKRQEALLVLTEEAASAGRLFMDGLSPADIQFMPLPYSIEDDAQ